MARGWDSKAVEDQVQDAQTTVRSDETRKPQSSPEEMDIHRRREVLLLSRTRVQRDLEASQNPRYKDQLTRALVDIDAQLSALSDSD
jgi:hypothetical protein